MSEVFTIQSRTEYEEKIKGSRFLCIACPVVSAEEAENRIKSFTSEYSDASHVCFAYVTGFRENRRFRFSDAGEPGGSAGRPILQAIESRNLTQVLIVVIRWFGGTKLGIGGLIRAYGGCAAQTLNKATIVPIVAEITLNLKVDYNHLNAVMRTVNEFRANFRKNYETDGILFRVTIPESNKDEFITRLMNLCRGKINIQQ